MSAQDLGARLLAEVQEEGLDEVRGNPPQSSPILGRVLFSPPGFVSAPVVVTAFPH